MKNKIIVNRLKINSSHLTNPSHVLVVQVIIFPLGDSQNVKYKKNALEIIKKNIKLRHNVGK